MMPVIIRRWKKLCLFIVSLVIFLGLFVFLDRAMLPASRMRSNAIQVVVLSSYRVLQKHLANYGEGIPSHLSPTQVSPGEYCLRSGSLSIYYYPNAWDKSGYILLKYKHGNFYYLVFGNGATATVTHWSDRSNDPNVKPSLLSPTNASKYIFGNLWFICISAIIIAYYRTCFVYEKRKKTEPPKIQQP